MGKLSIWNNVKSLHFIISLYCGNILCKYSGQGDVTRWKCNSCGILPGTFDSIYNAEWLYANAVPWNSYFITTLKFKLKRFWNWKPRPLRYTVVCREAFSCVGSWVLSWQCVRGWLWCEMWAGNLQMPPVLQGCSALLGERHEALELLKNITSFQGGKHLGSEECVNSTKLMLWAVSSALVAHGMHSLQSCCGVGIWSISWPLMWSIAAAKYQDSKDLISYQLHLMWVTDKVKFYAVVERENSCRKATRQQCFARSQLCPFPHLSILVHKTPVPQCVRSDLFENDLHPHIKAAQASWVYLVTAVGFPVT